ncbi:MAG: hypothetical protein K0S32_3997 [Bacteroidetes bacterium]|jgi:hypothetical protein|nr:hypothetical protein [Bacteroidota bacterium]
MSNDSFNFELENTMESYEKVYPLAYKSIFSSDKFLKYMMGICLFLITVSIFFSLKKKYLKKEFPIAATTMVVFGMLTLVRTYQSWDGKRDWKNYLKNLTGKGKAMIKLDEAGMEIKYEQQMSYYKWSQIPSLVTNPEYLDMRDIYGNSIFVIPRENFENDRWVKLQETIIAFINKDHSV